MNNYNIEESKILISQIFRETGHVKPSLIAEAYDIDIRVEDLPYTIIAIYTMIGHRSFIVLSDGDSEDMQEYNIALALYYHFREKARILLRAGPVDGDYSAAYFAYCLSNRSQMACPEERFEVPAIVQKMGKGRLH